MRPLSVLILCFLPASLTALDDASVADLVVGQGYPFEEHLVVTEDGYILTLHRIPFGKQGSGKVGRPVLMQHGVLCSSVGFLLTRPDKGLGFILADEGYDVWMPNSRGNTYSKMHKNLSVNSAEYWDFSFHEMGYYDLPASIDYILEKTGYKKLHYLGHSLGTAIFFVLASTRPEYNQKIIQMSAMAPIAFLGHTRGVVKVLSLLSSEIFALLKLMGTHEVLYDSWALHMFENIICKIHPFQKLICNNLVFLITGYDRQQWNVTLLPIIVDYMPTGTSVKQLQHLLQLAENGGNFRQYDYGHEKNLLRYGVLQPPDYDLSKITAPVVLHYSNNDWIAGVQDVERLNSSLPNSRSRLVPFSDFNHADFIWAVDVRPLLYDSLISIMKSYENE